MIGYVLRSGDKYVVDALSSGSPLRVVGIVYSESTSDAWIFNSLSTVEAELDYLQNCGMDETFEIVTVGGVE